MTSTSPPEQGQVVQVRSRPWVVNGVKASNLPTSALKLPLATPQHLLTLSSVEDDGLGEELQIVWEIEPGAKLVERVALPEPSSFDAPEKLDAFLDAVRWGAASTADVKNIQSPFRSGIEIEDYQLDPVVRVLELRTQPADFPGSLFGGSMCRFKLPQSFQDVVHPGHCQIRLLLLLPLAPETQKPAASINRNSRTKIGFLAFGS